jgi:hypothetical protein
MEIRARPAKPGTLGREVPSCAEAPGERAKREGAEPRESEGRATSLGWNPVFCIAATLRAFDIF